MKRIIPLVLILFLLTACSPDLIEEDELMSEQVSDTAKIVTVGGTFGATPYQRTDIVYDWEGKEFRNYFINELKPALTWIDENIEGATFLCWWDYGHMIRGYTGNDAVIFSPSEQILWSLSSGEWDEEGSGAFSSHMKIMDVADALTTTDPSRTEEVMEQYSADYIFVTKQDIASSFILFKIMGLDHTEYIDENQNPINLGAGVMLYRIIIYEDDIYGFEKFYNDDVVAIYKKV